MNPLGKWLTLARRGVVSPSLGEATWRQASAISRWGMGLAGQVRQAAARDPHRLAVIDADTGESLTYAALVARSDRVSKVLLRAEVGAQDRIGIVARNSLDQLLAILGASGIGAEIIPLHPGISTSQLRYLSAASTLTMVIYDEEFAEVARGMDVRTLSLRELVESAAQEGRRALDNPPSSPGRVTMLTAGGGPVPRGVRRDTDGMIENLVAFLDTVDLRIGDVVLASAPIDHMWGMSSVSLTFGVRGTLVLQRRFDAAAAYEALITYRCQAMFAVPVMLQRILELPPDGRVRALGELRVVASCGSRCPSGMTTDFMAAFGDVLYNIYGTTEISVATIATPTDLRRAPESVGVAPAGIRVSVLDDDLHAVPDGVTGRIFVHNPMARADYVDGSGRAAQHRGMQFTGDFGHLRDRLLFVDGREDEVVISSGQNVFPAELERALGHHPDVREVAAIGLPDREHGNRLVAFVVPRDPDAVHEAALIAYAKLEVTALRVPRQVLFVDALPRNDMGRVIGDGLRHVATVGS